MISQVSFTTDETLKNKALEKAKEEGITLKALLTYALKNFVKGKLDFDLVQTDGSDVEEIIFEDKELLKKAKKLANLLK